MVVRHATPPAPDQARTDLVFHALADATRRDIVRVVLRGEQSVSDLARRYPMSFAAVQKHVAVLERAELVSKRRRGREQLVRGEVDAVRRASLALDELERVWRHRIDRMGQLLAEPADGTDGADDTSGDTATRPTEPDRHHTTDSKEQTR